MLMILPLRARTSSLHSFGDGANAHQTTIHSEFLEQAVRKLQDAENQDMYAEQINQEADRSTAANTAANAADKLEDLYRKINQVIYI